MTRLRIVVFVLFSMLAVTWQTQVASAKSSMSLFDDFVQFYDCWSYWPIQFPQYALNCNQNCEDNPYWYWDAEDACDDFCSGMVADFSVAECITDCQCLIPPRK